MIFSATPSLSAPERKSSSAPAARSPLEHARNLIETRQEASAITVLKKFLASSPRPGDVDDAYLLLAVALISKKESEEGISYLNQLLSEFPESDLAGRARLMLGAAQITMGNLDAALTSLTEVRALPPTPDLKRQALRLIGEVQSKKGDVFKAIQVWVEELSLSPDSQRAEVRQRIRDAVLEKLDKKALLRLRDTYPTEFPGDLALIRLIEIQTSRGEEHLAERNARVFLNRFPNHDYAPAASDILRSIKEKLRTSQQVVTAVLPLSGRLQQFGIDSLNGIQLALEKGKDTLGVTSVALKVIDSETDKAVLRMELSDTLAEHRPLAVIGPLLSRDLQTMAGLAEQSDTPFITPSATMSDVHRLGNYVLSTAMTHPQQVQRLAEHALGNLGYRRFCILYPDTAYGQELAHLFGAEVKKRGGELIAVESYKETDTDFGPQIRRIKEEDLKRYGQAETTKTSKGTARTIYTPGFDAIFLPADSGQVALIAPQLLFYDVKVHLLGSNTWNSSDLLRLADRSIDGSIFVDGFFADSPDQHVREFVDRYRRRFQAEPSLFSAQAYDAMRVVLEAIRKGASSGQSVYEQLINTPDLPALAGTASFGPGGVLNRRLFIIYVKGGKLVQLN
ncbi:MAG TPA: penicillin-binding protein activator [Nitrospiraceae bacterium]|nr:penicillin-binding protein activator [Nitrospiraceae bacterium]